MKKYAVKIYYSGYSSYEIDANNENEAIEIARNLPFNKNEILSNLDNWREADEAFEVENIESKK